MGVDAREERSLGKIQPCWERINLHSAGVGQVLLTVNAKFLDIHCPEHEQNNGLGN
jgi:hypothetical protein